MKHQGINKASAALPMSFGDWSVRQDPAWAPRSTSNHENYKRKLRRSAQLECISSDRDVDYRESHK